MLVEHSNLSRAFHSDIDEGLLTNHLKPNPLFLDPKVFIDRGRQMRRSTTAEGRRYLRKAAERCDPFSPRVEEDDLYRVRPLEPETFSNRKHKCLLGGVRPVVSHEGGTQEVKLLGLFLENAHSIHSSPALSVWVEFAWRRPAWRRSVPKQR